MEKWTIKKRIDNLTQIISYMDIAGSPEDSLGVFYYSQSRRDEEEMKVERAGLKPAVAAPGQLQPDGLDHSRCSSLRP